MKKLLTLILLLVWTSSVQAGMVVGSGAAAGCTPSVLINQLGASDTYSESTWTGGMFTLSASTTVTGFVARACNDSAGSNRISIYNNKCTLCNGTDDLPNAEVTGTAVDAVASSNWGACMTYTNYEMTLGTPVSGLASGGSTKYWLVIQELSGNLVRGRRTETTGETRAYGTTLGGMTTEITSGMDFQIKGCQP
jgi:hypothetical protein